MGIAGGLVLGLRGLLRDFIVDPLVRLWWLIDSLPQGLVWLVVVVLGALVCVRTLGSLSRVERPRPRVPARPPDSQLAQLAHLIRRAEYSPAARRQLATRLAKTAVGIRARRKAIPPRQVWADLRAGRWPQDPQLLVVLAPPRFPWTARAGRDYLDHLSRAVNMLSAQAKGGLRDGP